MLSDVSRDSALNFLALGAYSLCALPFKRSCNTWGIVQWGGYLSAAMTNICRPYLQEKFEKEFGHANVHTFLDLAPLFLVGSTSYYIQRSLKVAALAGVFFAFTCKCIDRYAEQSAWNAIVIPDTPTKGYSLRYSPRTPRERKAEKLMEYRNRLKWVNELQMTMLRAMAASGKALEPQPNTFTELTKAFLPCPHNDSVFTGDSLDYIIREKSEADALNALSEEIISKSNIKYLISLTPTIIKGYAKHKQPKTLENFLKQFDEVLANHKKHRHTLVEERLELSFIVATGYCHLENQTEKILTLINDPDFNASSAGEKLEVYTHHVINLLDTYVEYQKPVDKDFATKITNHLGNPPRVHDYFHFLRGAEEDITYVPDKVRTKIKNQVPTEETVTFIERNLRNPLTNSDYESYAYLAIHTGEEDHLKLAEDLYYKLKDNKINPPDPVLLAKAYLHAKNPSTPYQKIL